MAYLVFTLVFVTPALFAQSITSGDITGTVTDATGAALPNAQVSLRNTATGATHNANTSSQGAYRFALLPPGPYNVSVNAPGFTQREQRVVVAAGQASTVDLQLAVASATTTVDVTENASVVQTENADNTTVFSTQQLLNLPNPGGDLTYVAQTAPGVVMNTQAGYGNLTVSGLPSTSNLFTINGQNTNDPYFNINNSGASNLLLGANEISEAAVVTNGYSGQWGQLSGAQVNYITLSGSNEFHGNANYFWNGRAMNANDFFANTAGQDRPFTNANQWSTRLGGPIWKNKTFFFVNYEGLRLVSPSASTQVKVPSPQFQAATLANLTATGRSALVPFYQQLFSVYNNSPYIGLAQPVTNSCGGVAFAGLAAGAPCTLSYRVSAPNSAKEYQWAGRVDHQLTDADRVYLRLFRDNGTQPTATDPVSPVFNAYSPQPQMSGQVHETHTFGGKAVNEINFSTLYYSAAFYNTDQAGALQALPTVVRFTGTFFTNAGGTSYNFPQGRRITQYQLIDDFSYITGRHNLKFGVNYHRDDITELSYSVLTNGLLTVGSLSQFFAGGGSSTNLQIRYPTAQEEPLALYVLGAYAQDEWRVSNNLRLTLSLRLDHNSNPVCQQDCFSRFAAPFTGQSVPVSTPYNTTILTGQHQAYPATNEIIWQPRIGMAWQPLGSEKTVVRGGIGIFGDEIPALLARNLTRLTPNLNAFTISNALVAGPGIAGTPFATAASANQVLRQQFANGGTLASIRQQFPGFALPSYSTTDNFIKQPRVYEWNLELQQALGWNTLLSLNYVGTRGVGWLVPNAGLNAFGISGLPVPAAQPDPRFGTITTYTSQGTSRYNGLTVSLRKRFSHGLVFGANYTWSHAFDNVANGGLLQLDLSSNASIQTPQNPYNLNQYNYGNSDQDVRHYFSGNFVLDDFVYNLARRGPKTILGGWTLSGNIFFRTGLPYTVIDSGAGAVALANRYGNTIFASPIGRVPLDSCGHSAVDTPCLSPDQFLPAAESVADVRLGNQTRNQFRGPNFFDTDITVTKGFKITERIGFQVGAQFYNVFNHPNFDKPVGDIADPNFGLITSSVSVPTSILGSFVGAQASPRLIQLKGRVTF